jgi:hypothetical protein
MVCTPAKKLGKFEKIGRLNIDFGWLTVEMEAWKALYRIGLHWFFWGGKKRLVGQKFRKTFFRVESIELRID